MSIAAPLSQAKLFEVRGLSKRFGRIGTLEDVGFDVRAGAVLGLIGPNGASKTTLVEQSRTPRPGSRQGRPLVENRQHELSQGFRCEPASVNRTRD